ncbi:disulfide bond formation protein B [Oceaniglobus indicus]|uniref:disulfide bond formation protein B n=1 Tax=Oceaniglobus indicus TaxID=2047749 RepID=UPI001F4DAB69|nr:disulfide bond formation protein B [Oceaniglobus indicus]
MMHFNRRSLILCAAAGSFLLLLGAFVFQALGYPPCAMCLWQRWPHAAAVAFGAIGFFWPARVVAAGGALAAFITGAIGVFHAGVELKLWQGPTSCTGTGGGLSGLSGADLLDPTAAPALVMCDQVAWSLLGVSMAGWNAILSFALVAVWVVALRRD